VSTVVKLLRGGSPVEAPRQGCKGLVTKAESGEEGKAGESGTADGTRRNGKEKQG